MDQGSGATVVRWEFTRGTERLVCQVERALNADAVLLVSNRHLQRASLARVHAAAAALRRHAMLSARLRAEGWTVAGYTPTS